MNRRAVAFWVGLGAALLVLGFVSGQRTRSGAPLDPDSTEPLGTRALIIFLEEFGTDVLRDLPDESVDTTLMLADELTPDQRSALRSWIEGGGTLVVSDPGSTFAPDSVRATIDSSGGRSSGSCTIDELAGLELEASSFVLYPIDDAPAGPLADAYCFGDDAEAYVHVTLAGEGRIVALGGALPVTNQNLDEVDNAVLAAQLLLPDGEPAVVSVLFEPIYGPGTRSLGDLIPTSAKWAAWQLLVAFALYVAWRAPRFGRPVTEPQPVELPASLLVRAAGELHRRSGGHARASAALRSHLERRLRNQLRASPELGSSELVRTAAAGHDLDPAVIERALIGPPATDGSQLADLVADIDQVNAELFDDRGTDPVAVTSRPAGQPT